MVRGRLSEPNEIHLGVGKIARGGRGFGSEQEQQLVDALAGSEAARVGVIEAIQEFELHVRGIGPDKVSDLIANIILDKLARFSERVCEQHGIATRPCAVSGFWNTETNQWDGGYFNLPAVDTRAYILVPKRFVRRDRDLMNHRVFYRKYVLDILQRELLSADDALVETLQSGKRRVTKKSIQEDERFKPTKEYISRFIIENPDVIDEYRSQLLDDFNPVDPALFSGKFEEDCSAAEKLDGIKPGLGE